jgi:hypothetical protein
VLVESIGLISHIAAMHVSLVVAADADVTHHKITITLAVSH